MRGMNKIAIIVPYFGNFPETFELWKESCRRNSKFDWIIITDQKFEGDGNIKGFHITMSAIEKRASDLIGWDVKISTPYKLCDYRPLYGEIFQDLLKEYDFWGHCDMDLIFGDLLEFVTEDLLNSYDKFFIHGHFVLYRNSDEVNNWWKKYTTEEQRKEVFLATETRAFDEFGINENGMAFLVPNTEKVYYKETFDDLDYSQFSFSSQRIIQDKIKSKKTYPMIFEFDHGKLYRYIRIGKKLYKDESMYVHFQKREIEIPLNFKSHEHYFIIPNRVISGEELKSDVTIKRYCKYRKFYFRYYRFRYNNLKRKLKSYFKSLQGK